MDRIITQKKWWARGGKFGGKWKEFLLIQKRFLKKETKNWIPN